MARYRKIDTRIWNDKKFNDLSDDGKFVFFLLLTHPHLTPLGAMRATFAGLASEIGWSLERFQLALKEGFAKGIVEYDESAAFIWLPNFLKYNQPESPNVVKSWEQYLDYLPECFLKNDLIKNINKFVKNLTSSFQEALPQVFLKGMANQEQEQDQEQDQEQKKIYRSGKPDVDSFCNDKNEQKIETNISKTLLNSQALEVLHFLNEKTGRAYRSVDTNLKFIIDRLKSGATVMDCRQVIVKKTREWKSDIKMSEYLRPATLFNAVKFEQYMGELVLPEEADHGAD